MFSVGEKAGDFVAITEILIRIVFAVFASGIIGYEREMRDRPAGFRTHILVCVGATIVSLIQLQMVENTTALIAQHPELASSLKADIGRVVAQVVTGVGFLGAGTIIFQKGSVKGLTTATTLWVVACLGLAIGLGYYKISVIATLVILFVIIVLKKIEEDAKRRKFHARLEIKYNDSNGDYMLTLLQKARKTGAKVFDMQISKEGKKTFICILDLHLAGFSKVETIIARMAKDSQVLSIKRL